MLCIILPRGLKGTCKKSDKLPQMMSLESVSVGAENYKFEDKKKLQVLGRKFKVRLPDLFGSSLSLLETEGSKVH